jgi:hypothetical protein
MQAVTVSNRTDFFYHMRQGRIWSRRYKSPSSSGNKNMRKNCYSLSIYLNDTKKTLHLKWINTLRIVMLLKKMIAKSHSF